jgi:UDP-arabinose 4-epimerase
VIGGAGYVGAHTCKALSRAGYQPVVLDNLSTGHESFVRWGPIVRADIRETSAVREVLDRYCPAAVMHFAALASVGESVTDPQSYYDNNVVGSLSLLRTMLEAGCLKLIFSSSCAIYGQPSKQPIHETTRPAPVNPYGHSKLMVENILADYGRAYGLRSIALRYFNASGADPDGELGELRDPEVGLIPRAMMALQGYLSDFMVFGNDYDTPDGTAIRDYVHVADLAEAHVAALRRLLAGRPSGAFNLGTGHGHSVKQVLDMIVAETGQSLSMTTGARRPGDPPVLVADPSHAKSELSFAPQQSDLKTIIRTAWDWHRRAHGRKEHTQNVQSTTEARARW